MAKFILNLDGPSLSLPSDISSKSFDYVARYQLIAEIIIQYRQFTGRKPKNILDVGGLGSFLDKIIDIPITILDSEAGDTKEEQRGDGARMDSIPDGTYDIVITSDTLEHIPRKDRKLFIKELFRVSKDLVILCAPFSDYGATEQEMLVQRFYKAFMGTPHRWLKEHSDYVLPKEVETLEQFKSLSKSVAAIRHSDARLWRDLLSVSLAANDMGANNVTDAATKINQYYNEELMFKDFTGSSYRTFLVAAKEHEVIFNSPDTTITTDELIKLNGLIADFNTAMLENKDLIPSIKSEFSDAASRHQQEIEDLKLKYAKRVNDAESERAQIIGSISWRITLPLRLVNGVVWKLKQKIRITIFSIRRNPQLRPFERADLRKAVKNYSVVEKEFHNLKKAKNTEVGVVVHLYYTEAWPQIKNRLDVLKKHINFDLFVTLPEKNKPFLDEIHVDFPAAYTTIVPNRGRDVLPFIEIARMLQEKGYAAVLKVHSKRSLHRDDGEDWFMQMITSLVPDNPALYKDLLKKLRDSSTGIIGPENQYVPLSVNYRPNAFFLLKMLRKIYPRQTIIKINGSHEDYGFFAGTMFWARLDAFSSVLHSVKVTDFESEKGQIDTTPAHALERLFCLVPEIESKKMYEIRGAAVAPIDYSTSNIPEWSDLHVDVDRILKDKDD